MVVKLTIPNYDGNAIDGIWDSGARIALSYVKDSVCILANKEGLESLGKQMIYMAKYYDQLSEGDHIHFDKWLTGQNDSNPDLIIEIMKKQ